MSNRHPLEFKALRQSTRLVSQGAFLAAQECLWDALVQEPNLPGVHVALAKLRWPGPDYRFWLSWFHTHLVPRIYLEIGVEKGDSLAQALPATRVIGVDPAPIGDPLRRCRGPGRMYRQISSDFFKNVPVDSGLESGGFDLAFIDGDHRFEAVLEDFVAAERHAAPGSVLLLHDTLPLNSATAAREHRTGFYTADGWKIVPCLRSLRPDLHIVTLPTAPTGLTVVTGLDPSSRILGGRSVSIRHAYSNLSADYALAAPRGLFAIGVNDPQWMTCWLQSARGQ
ncbi:class I SAM-dependent methyltransferase [Acidovorax sp. D2M1]|uniref:Class I SAM-dependent methyltransferase n=1 Tax=Acidovorax benzenivorans TaxID=2987520 RepID=A0ABT5RX20_9BURK|nr:class I SAM-dependent methyltransferase [Acidovorax benzenivorans]MDD2177940.1 class I SAM-dependent methyltransferase [Acidovorax benzenivorans]